MAERTTINSFLDDFARRGAETAYVHRRGLRTVRWSYARVAETAFRFARELEARGVGRGERVLVWAGNSPEWVAAFFGCALRGAVVVPLDVESTTEFVARVQRQVAAKLILVGDGVAHADAHTQQHADGQASQAAGLNIPALRLEELTELVARHNAAPYHAAEVAADDLVEIIFTSGTTDEPRGVQLAHRNFLANLAPLEEEIKRYLKWERLVHPIRFLNLVPLSHVFGQFMGIFVPQMLGGEVHFRDSLNPSELVETIRRERVSIVVTVPRLLETLREHVERHESSKGRGEWFARALAAAKGMHPLRRWWTFRRVHRRFGLKFWAFITGGATLPAETETFWHRLGFAVLQGYGMTETASLITVNHPFKKGRGSVGQALPGHELKLAPDGEILVRGRNVSPGYWGGDSITDADGWLRTGDLGESDAAGNIFFKGRKKEVIVTAAGLNLYPEDLEAALNRQPEVRACAVVGVEGPRGPEPHAFIIPKDDKTDTARAVERANLSLARHQQILRWTIWPEPDFPRTPTQKIRKRDILKRMGQESGVRSQKSEVGKDATDEERRATDNGRRTTDSSSLIPHPSSLISSLVARVGGEVPARLDASASLSNELKLDSLGRVELLSALEDRYQVELDEAAFTAATTLGDIERLVQEGAAASDTSIRYPYPRWAQRAPVTWLRVLLLYAVVLPITFALSRARVRGASNLRGVSGPVLFVSNHITYIDHALILHALPGRFRRWLAIAQEGERLRWWRRPPVGTPLMRRLRWQLQYALVVLFFNTFSLPQKSGFRRSFAYAGETVDRGFSVLVFPEGTRSDDGSLCPFMGGTGLLATKLGIPVVPIYIHGLGELKRRGRRVYAPSGSITVILGEPVSFNAHDDPADVTRELERRVAALRPKEVDS